MKRTPVLFTQQELFTAIDFARNREAISVQDLIRKFDKSYQWASQIMDTLEELSIVEPFEGKKERTVIQSENK